MPVIHLRYMLELQVWHDLLARLVENTLLCLPDLLPNLLISILNLCKMTHVLYFGRPEVL